MPRLRADFETIRPPQLRFSPPAKPTPEVAESIGRRRNCVAQLSGSTVRLEAAWQSQLFRHEIASIPREVLKAAARNLSEVTVG